MCHTSRVLILLGLLSVRGSLADAQGMTPVVGGKAPSLIVGPSFKGSPDTKFRPGKVYVVEFWATWCKPCLQQLPHVRELQRQYPDVEFLWVDVWEGDEPSVRGFVERMGDQMPFTVAMDAQRDADGIGATARAWLPATGIKGIPATVLIDAEGRVAWMGPPEQLDRPLRAVVAGSWDLAAAARESQFRRDLARTLETYDARLRTALDQGPAATQTVLDDYIKALKAHRATLTAQPPEPR